MERDINRELLELAAFEGEELEKFYPIWLKTAEKLYLTDEIVTFSVDTYIPQNWDIKYVGVRKMIGAYLREIAEVVSTPELKAKGVKIVYGIYLPASVRPTKADPPRIRTQGIPRRRRGSAGPPPRAGSCRQS